MIYATRLRNEILRRISIGTFEYGDYFPNSRKLKKLGLAPKAAVDHSFETVADKWYSGLIHKSKGTLDKYSQALAFWKLHLGDKLIDQIVFSDLRAIIGQQKWNPKHGNNMLIPLRQVFEMAYLDGIIDKIPTERIVNSKVQKAPPDPFELHEVDDILGKLKQEQVANYFEFAFFTGMRPEEIIALQWGDIDFNAGLVRVQRTRSARADSEKTKTHKVRDVELNSRSSEALKRQKLHTFMKDEYVFHNPVTNRRWGSEESQRELYWNPVLKDLGIRHRTPYQCRHTYATLALMAGAN